MAEGNTTETNAKNRNGEMKLDLTNAEPEVKEDGLRHRQTFSIERSVYNQEELDEDYDGGPRKLKSPREKLALFRERNRCSPSCTKNFIFSFFPFIDIMKKYRLKRDLLPDIIAGLTVGIMQIPQGMAYAVLASLEPVYGLYMSFFPIIVYFFFGTSRHLSFGTFAVISLMVGGAVDRLCGEEEEEMAFMEELKNSTNGSDIDSFCAIEVASALSFIGGLMQIGMSFLHLGFIVIYLSEPMTRGFTTGCGFHVFTSQLKSIFGVSIPRHNGAFKLIYTYRDLILALPRTNPAAVIASVICGGAIYVTKEFLNPPIKKKLKVSVPIPIDLVIVILGTVVSYYGNFETKYNLDVIGEVPTGLPEPVLPPTNLFSDVVVDGLVVAIVSYAISISMAQSFAEKLGYTIDANQELLAHGITNFVCSNFRCYMMSVSLSRSLVQENVGGVTQIAGLVAALLMLVVLLALAGLFEALPSCVLAAIIIVALKGMFMQMKDIPRLWRISKTDLSVWLVTFAAVVLLDIDLGLLVGVAWSFLTVIGRTQRWEVTVNHRFTWRWSQTSFCLINRPYICEMGRVGDTDMYADTRNFEKTSEIPGVKIIRFESSVYFANRDYFINRVYQKSRCHPKEFARSIKKAHTRRSRALREGNEKNDLEIDVEAIEERYPIPTAPIHHLILDCSTIGFLDSTGVTGLSAIIREYKEVDIEVFLAAAKPGIRELLEESGAHEKIPRSCLYPTLHDAVLASLQNRQEVKALLHIEAASTRSSPPSYAGHRISSTAEAEPGSNGNSSQEDFEMSDPHQQKGGIVNHSFQPDEEIPGEHLETDLSTNF